MKRIAHENRKVATVNYIRTILLLVALTALLMWIGAAFADKQGMMIALTLSLIYHGFVFLNGERIALRQHDAQEPDKSAAHAIRIVEDLSARAGISAPRVYLTDCAQPNAFSAGRGPNNAALVLSTGLLAKLDLHQLTGVIAHELAHIKNRDAMTMTAASTIVGTISTIASIAALVGFLSRRHGGWSLLGIALVAPLIAAFLRMAIGRSIEYEADRAGAEMCGHPEWIASALRKIVGDQALNERAIAHPATASMFMVCPLPETWLRWIFDTHPPIEKRIARLERMQGNP